MSRLTRKESIWCGADGKVFRLPYRLVFAVATLNSLYIYDTQSDGPVAILAGLHYAAITDLAWYFADMIGAIVCLRVVVVVVV